MRDFEQCKFDSVGWCTDAIVVMQTPKLPDADSKQNYIDLGVHTLEYKQLGATNVEHILLDSFDREFGCAAGRVSIT